MNKQIKNFLTFVSCIIICQLAGVIGSFFTVSSLDSWYDMLIKPSFNPPGWVFGPVWTILYLLMGIALYIVWQKGRKNYLVKVALIVFAIQLVLNSLWSVLFFGIQSPLAAFIEIIYLWMAIFITILFFARVSKLASYLLYPYLAWVSFATFLNYSLWLLN